MKPKKLEASMQKKSDAIRVKKTKAPKKTPLSLATTLMHKVILEVEKGKKNAKMAKRAISAAVDAIKHRDSSKRPRSHRSPEW